MDDVEAEQHRVVSPLLTAEEISEVLFADSRITQTAHYAYTLRAGIAACQFGD